MANNNQTNQEGVSDNTTQNQNTTPKVEETKKEVVKKGKKAVEEMPVKKLKKVVTEEEPEFEPTECEFEDDVGNRIFCKKSEIKEMEKRLKFEK